MSDLDKAVHVIESCETADQLKVALEFANRYVETLRKKIMPNSGVFFVSPSTFEVLALQSNRRLDYESNRIMEAFNNRCNFVSGLSSQDC